MLKTDKKKISNIFESIIDVIKVTSYDKKYKDSELIAKVSKIDHSKLLKECYKLTSSNPPQLTQQIINVVFNEILK